MGLVLKFYSTRYTSKSRLVYDSNSGSIIYLVVCFIAPIVIYQGFSFQRLGKEFVEVLSQRKLSKTSWLLRRYQFRQRPINVLSFAWPEECGYRNSRLAGWVSQHPMLHAFVFIIRKNLNKKYSWVNLKNVCILFSPVYISI